MEEYSINTKNALLEYESLFREGKRKRLSKMYFEQTPEENEKTAIAIFKYVFEKLLGWTPIDVLNCLSLEVIQEMKLTVPYKKLRFPKELSHTTDYFYVAKICYPEAICFFGERDLILRLYSSLLKKENGKYPKEYFVGAEGAQRAITCLQYVLSNLHIFRDQEELYETFSDPVTAKQFLAKYRLAPALKMVYDGDALEYLHDALPPKQKNDLLYYLGRFNQVYVRSKAKTIELSMFTKN